MPDINPKSEISCLIVYASYTGHTESLAVHLAEFLKKEGVNVKIEECTQVEADEFNSFDLCVVATYTFGRDGDLPDEIEDLYVHLGEQDLTGKTYGVLGTGEKKYDRYCQSVTDFDNQFEKTGAVKGSESLKIELYTEEKELGRVEEFGLNLIKTFQNSID